LEWIIGVAFRPHFISKRLMSLWNLWGKEMQPYKSPK
jgi:hypothetical protein